MLAFQDELGHSQAKITTVRIGLRTAGCTYRRKLSKLNSSFFEYRCCLAIHAVALTIDNLADSYLSYLNAAS
jgi:hypothetical protein